MSFSEPVSDYMSRPVHSVRPDTRMPEVIRKLAELRISCLAVTADNGRMVGVVSRSDLLRVGGRQAAAESRDTVLSIPDCEVSELMSLGVIHVEPRSRVTEAAEKMVTNSIHRVFVSEGDRVLGVVSTTDIMRIVAEEGVSAPSSKYVRAPAITVDIDDPLSMAISPIVEMGASGVVVVSDGRAVGIVTGAELLAAHDHSMERPVADVMARSPVVLTGDTPLYEAAGRTIEADALAMVVRRANGSYGLLAGIDFARVAVREHSAAPSTNMIRRSSVPVVMVLAGGRGKRLHPLTCHRAKPAVPFGGRYRIIDFVLANVLNSGYQRVYVLTQYMASSLIHHIATTWPTTRVGQSVEVVPAQMRHGPHWYEGTADSVLQNLNLIKDANSEHVAVFGGDHIYTFAVAQMERAHRDRDVDLTVATYPVAVEDAHHFGVVEVDENHRIIGFQEKPESNPKTIPGQPDKCLVSMGNYFFRTRVIEQVLRMDARDPESSHDFGKDVIPRMVREGYRVFSYDFGANLIPGEHSGSKPYWRDVGTIDSFYDANMELRSPLPELNLYNRSWPLRSASRDFPPARFVKHGSSPVSEVRDSLVCEGTIVESASLTNVVAGYDCYFHDRSEVIDSVILGGCDIGAKAKLSLCVLDKNCSIAPGAVVEGGPDVDRTRFPFVSDRGLIVLPKGTHVPKEGPIELSEDVIDLLRNDVETDGMYDGFSAENPRHSYDSVGPVFQKFGRPE